jgi:hypothetical protein
MENLPTPLGRHPPIHRRSRRAATLRIHLEVETDAWSDLLATGG